MRALLHSRSGSSATEFAMVLPLLLILLFGAIDGGRWIWTNNRAEKATQMGARLAVVTDAVSSTVDDSYVGACSPALEQGDSIPADCFSQVTCTDAGCSSGMTNTTAFNNIVARMRNYMPEITAANVTVEYNPSGLGFAGNPYGPDVSPLVTVKLSSLQFQPIVCMVFLCSLSVPTATTTLSSEDLTGSQSN